jgi:membrane protease YdiL (CAAX protease family)
MITLSKKGYLIVKTIIEGLITIYFAGLLGGFYHTHQIISWVQPLKIGVMLGIVCALVGILLFMFFRPIRNSIAFLEGDILKSIKFMQFVAINFIAAILEEFFARGYVLFLWVKHANLITVILVALGINIVWAVGHIGNRFDELLKCKVHTIHQASWHVILVFASGFAFNIAILATNSLIASIIAHYILNFIFAIYYRIWGYKRCNSGI